MEIGLIWYIVKYLVLAIFLLFAYNFYLFIIKPFWYRSYYSKFSNVYVSENFIPLVGDAKKYLEDTKNGKVRYYHQIEYALKLSKYDLRLFTAGSMTIINVTSARAFKEFLEKIPEFFDRRSLAHKSFGKICPLSMMFSRTSDNWKKRRESFLKEMGINFASRFIPIMIDSAEERMSTWKQGQKFDMLKEMNHITFKVITIILFGKDVNEQVGTIDYINKEGVIEKLPFAEFFIVICKDLMSTNMNPRDILFPFLAQYELVKPHSTTYKNRMELFRVLREYLKKSDDKEAVYYRLTELEKYDVDETFFDMLGFLFAGHETSSHAVTSALYFMKKYPDTKTKLLEELKPFVKKSSTELKSILTKDKINSLEYLYNIVKETLRIDAPANDAIPYQCFKETEILGVPIKAGQIMNISIVAQHYNPNIWKEPLKFIPERFDSESEYYMTSKENKARAPMSWIPFSFGPRNCPGQSLALLETKVILIYFLSKLDYKIDQELIDSDYAYFSVISQLKCEFEPIFE